MASVRLIARLDIKAPYLIKTIRLEGLRKLGVPHDFALRYYEQGIDEIIYIDAVASLYQRNSILELVAETARDVFIPLTVGGGIRSVSDARDALRAGADKVAINTAATQRPELITEMAEVLGTQCVVLEVQAKRRPEGGWEAYSEMGREHTGRDAIEWAREGAALGAGEILLTSVDQEGMRGGFDIELVRAVAAAVNIPVIASGGMGKADHLNSVIDSGASAVAMAHVLHYDVMNVAAIRDAARAHGVPVRTL